MAAARALGSVTLRILSVAIPTKLFTAQSEKKISFNKIVKATGARVKQQLLEETTGTPVGYEDLVPGYEYELGKFVTFTKDELKSIEIEANPDEVRIREIVPLATLDSRHLGKAQYLGPDKGSEHAFALIAHMLVSRGVAAIGQRGGQTRDELIVIRAQEHGLVMHEALYANEVRSLAETIPAASFTFGVEELELAGRLFDSIAMPAFSADRFVDRGAERIKEAVAKKVAGKQIVIPAPTSQGAAAPAGLLEQLRLAVPPRGKSPGVAKSKKSAPASEVVPRRGRARSSG